MCGKAEDFKHNAKKWAHNTDPDKDEVLEQRSKSSYALYKQQSQHVRDLSNRIEKDSELDKKLAAEAAKNLRAVSYNMDMAIDTFINSLEKTPQDPKP